MSLSGGQKTDRNHFVNVVLDNFHLIFMCLLFLVSEQHISFVFILYMFHYLTTSFSCIPFFYKSLDGEQIMKKRTGKKNVVDINVLLDTNDFKNQWNRLHSAYKNYHFNLFFLIFFIFAFSIEIFGLIISTIVSCFADGTYCICGFFSGFIV